jgi:hypothetical protein
MSTRSWFVAALVCLGSTAALAQRQLPEVETQARPVQVALSPIPETEACVWTVQPLPIRDAADALWFASGPTASLNQEELHAYSLAPLVNIAILGNQGRLFIVGAPVGTQLRFNPATGWAPVWPFC